MPAFIVFFLVGRLSFRKRVFCRGLFNDSPVGGFVTLSIRALVGHVFVALVVLFAEINI